MSELEQARDIFIEASGLSPRERDDYIDRRTEGDAKLRRLILALMEEAETIDPQSVAPTGTQASLEREADRQIGRYRVVERLGEGGFGIVYRAVQEEPVSREVALKVIKPGMDSAAIVRRFEGERQSLAVMNHPYVARIYDGGTTDSGRPYFVMDLVTGETLTTFCARERLSLTDRLRLFINVCEAVQHAHSKGVIHRDLKPSNILVTRDDDGAPVPKVIDFGIAKALGEDDDNRAQETVQGQVIGTPDYMSPEQAAGRVGDIDTRSDVYSLGVILYELLVGERPFDFRARSRRGWADVQRVICDEPPSRPSSRISAQRQAAHTDGILDPRSLRAALRRDLDWLIMRCLEKDPARRYATVSALAADIGRFLRSEPLEAGPPSLRYRTNKFIVRNKVAVSGAMVFLLLLIAGLLSTTWGLLEARSAQRAEAAQRAEVERQRSRAEAVTTFFSSDVIGAASPSRLGERATVLEAVDFATERLATSLEDQPQLRASVERDAGRLLLDVSQFERAEHLLEAALVRFESLGPDGLIDWALTHLDLASLAIRNEEGEQALVHATEALKVLREQLPEDDPQVLVAERIHADALRWAKRPDDARQAYKETLDAQRRALGAESLVTATTLYDYGLLMADLGEYDSAESMLRESLSIRQSAGKDGAEDALESQAELGLVLLRQHRTKEALDLFDDVVPDMIDVYGERHWRTLQTRVNQNIARVLMGNASVAAEEFPNIIEAYRRQFPPSGERVIYATLWAANALSTVERYQEAQGILRIALEDLDAVPDAREDLVSSVVTRLVDAIEAVGGADDLEALRERDARLQQQKAEN